MYKFSKFWPGCAFLNFISPGWLKEENLRAKDLQQPVELESHISKKDITIIAKSIYTNM